MDQDTDIDQLLGRDAADEVRAAVASGEYASPEAAIREAVESWRLDRFEREPWVRQAIREGLDALDAGRVVPCDLDAIFERAEARVRK